MSFVHQSCTHGDEVDPTDCLGQQALAAWRRNGCPPAAALLTYCSHANAIGLAVPLPERQGVQLVQMDHDRAVILHGALGDAIDATVYVGLQRMLRRARDADD